MECRSPSPPLHFPDIRSTPSPLRRRLPRPLPEPPSRLPHVGVLTPSSSSLASAASSRASSEGSESVLAIIHEIDDALQYTNSTRRRQKPARFSAPDYFPPPPAVFSLSPPRSRTASASSTLSVCSSSLSSAASSSSESSSLLSVRTLRRQFSPRNESLREIRARDSEICLQRVYEQQVMMYLDGSIFAVRRPLQDDPWGSPP